MPKLDRLILRSADPGAKAAFYAGILGMRQIADACFSYGDAEIAICFEEAVAGPYVSDAADLYWKIAIAVPDLGLACAQLRDRGVAVSAPRQFRDVGYLAHIADPEGFVIELIQHVFEGDTSPMPVDSDLLGGGPCLNLLTLRCDDPAVIYDLCERDLGMRPLSVQPVAPRDFTLYFFAFTDEVPPSADLTAVENRPWTYQRPYTVLEVQHPHSAKVTPIPGDRAPGYAGARITGTTVRTDNRLGLIGDPN